MRELAGVLARPHRTHDRRLHRRRPRHQREPPPHVQEGRSGESLPRHLRRRPVGSTWRTGGRLDHRGARVTSAACPWSSWVFSRTHDPRDLAGRRLFPNRAIARAARSLGDGSRAVSPGVAIGARRSPRPGSPSMTRAASLKASWFTLGAACGRSTPNEAATLSDKNGNPSSTSAGCPIARSQPWIAPIGLQEGFGRQDRSAERGDRVALAAGRLRTSRNVLACRIRAVNGSASGTNSSRSVAGMLAWSRSSGRRCLRGSTAKSGSPARAARIE